LLFLKVEGLGDLIHSDTEEQRKQALRQMDGHLSKVQENWRQRLVSNNMNLIVLLLLETLF